MSINITTRSCPDKDEMVARDVNLLKNSDPEFQSEFEAAAQSGEFQVHGDPSRP